MIRKKKQTLTTIKNKKNKTILQIKQKTKHVMYCYVKNVYTADNLKKYIKIKRSALDRMSSSNV